MSKEWYQHNNIAVKLQAGLDAVINGQGLPYVFAGLEKGSCVVEVVYNGETCTFYNKTPTLPPLNMIPDKVGYFKGECGHDVPLGNGCLECAPKTVVEDNEVYNKEFTPVISQEDLEKNRVVIKNKRTRKPDTTTPEVTMQ